MLLKRQIVSSVTRNGQKGLKFDHQSTKRKKPSSTWTLPTAIKSKSSERYESRN